MNELLVAPRLSVLIPVFNWDSSRLIAALADEITTCGLAADVEIHLFDDASQPVFRESNRQQVQAARSHGVTVWMHQAPRNVGRSVARNTLVGLARGRLLLFLDADVLPDAPDFLQRYMVAGDSGDAVCGGISYRQCAAPAPPERFYLRYSCTTSVADAAVRMGAPCAWVYTASILVSRETITRVPFDSGFVGYGYEDLEWGLRISQGGHIQHIDNAVTHLGLLSKRTLVRKSAEAAHNLVRLWRLHPAAAQGMLLVRLSRRFSLLPAALLRAGAATSRWLFLTLPGPFVAELGLFQADKVLRSALAFRRGRSSGPVNS